MNNSFYQLNKNQTTVDGLYVEIAAVIFGLCVAFWTIFANTSITICFFVNRKKSFPAQIVSLCVCDMCVGYAFLPLAVFPLVGADVRIRACVLIRYLFFASQCASLFHIFGICVHRYIVIQNLTKIDRKEPSVLLSLILIISAWTASFVLCSLPTIIFGIPNPEGNGCNIDEIYGNNAQTVRSFLFWMYLAAQILTNILYVVSCIRLKCILAKVFPHKQQSSTEIFSCEPPSVTKEMSANMLTIRIQKKVLGTIGIVLLIFNICTIPEIVMLKLEDKSRSLRYILSALFVLNSAFNPVIYAARTKCIRLPLEKLFNDFVRNLFC